MSKWIKASERLPGWYTPVKWRRDGYETAAKETIEQVYYRRPLSICEHEWLDESTPAEDWVKPPVTGSLLLLELMQVAAITNEDGMPVVQYVDKPNGGSVAYLRHDAVVKKLNALLELKPSLTT